MGGKVILAHDLGTTGNKASLYDQEGKLIKSCYRAYETHYPNPGWVEQRPEDWWQALIDSTQEVLTDSGIDPGQILGLSFSGQMMAGIPVDKDGKVLQESIMIWADHRSGPQAEAIEKKIGWEKYYQTTGAGMAIPLYPIAKILWLKEHAPEVYKQTYKFLGAKDILIQRLTGRFATDYSDASNTGLLDIHKRAWAADLIKDVGIDLDKLSDEILPSHTVIGKVGKQAAGELGLVEGTPVVLGGGDVSCAALGAGVIDKGSAYNYIGSASWLAIASPQPIADEKMRPFTLCHVVPERYVVQVAMFSAGVAFEWFRDQVCLKEGLEAEASDKDAYDIMTELASASPPGAQGLLFLPNMRPGGAPHNNLNDKGAIVGLTLSHTRGDILRAVLEGITFNIRLMCEAMEQQAGAPFSELRMIGGGSKSALWRDIEASILNKNIVTLSAHQEANVLGASIIAGVALGVFDSFADGVSKYVKRSETIEPKEEWSKVYEQQFPIFNRAYTALCPVNDDLTQIRNPLDD
ncbi:MAG TPA: xylulokinase [Anaerolineae bacterium]|nr:xylulokinase [Anaerolineae bacterium]